MIGDRIEALERFFGVRKPKQMNPITWLEALYDLEMEWEERNKKPFPI